MVIVADSAMKPFFLAHSEKPIPRWYLQVSNDFTCAGGVKTAPMGSKTTGSH